MAVIAVAVALFLAYWRHTQQIRLVEQRELELERGPVASRRASPISASRNFAKTGPTDVFSTVPRAGSKSDATVEARPSVLTCSNGSTNIANAAVFCAGSVVKEAVLYSFGAGSADGVLPLAGLIMDNRGNLFGTTWQGGRGDEGTVFEINQASGTETVLYSFGTNGSDGYHPYAGLIMDSGGNLYGTTDEGGASDYGTVFEISHGSGKETKLYSFGANDSDGRHPSAGLIMDSAGNLYGTTTAGGANGYGTVFEISHAKGKEAVLYSFTGMTDSTPGGQGQIVAPLVMDHLGDLYGTTADGGTDNVGTVFEISHATGKEIVLHTFIGVGTGGMNPGGSLIVDRSGHLYGTTANGGANSDGTVFGISDESGEAAVLHSFGGGKADGRAPDAGLIMDGAGNLYGTTSFGGAHDDGTVFEISHTGQETVLYSFAGADGKNPQAGLIMDGAGNLYGTTKSGGASDDGTVFRITGASGRTQQMSQPGAEPTVVQGPALKPVAQPEHPGQDCEVAPKEEPEAHTEASVWAQPNQDANLAFQQQDRQKLCAALPVGERCEPAVPAFGAQPPGSIKYVEQVPICSVKTGVCSATPLEFPLRGVHVPAGCFLNRIQTVSIVPKAGGVQTFRGQETYAWQFGELQEDDQDRDWYSYLGYDQVNRYIWIGEEGYEDASTSLISYDTGHTDLSTDAEILRMSPDGRYLLADGDEGGPAPNTVTLYSFTGGGIKQVGAFQIPGVSTDDQFLWVTSKKIAVLDSSDVIVARITEKGSAWLLSAKSHP